MNRTNTNTCRVEIGVDSLMALLDGFMDAFNTLEDLHDRAKANAKKYSTESGILTKIKKFFKAIQNRLTSVSLLDRIGHLK